MFSNIRLKKSLSQHFLKDSYYAERIVESIDIKSDDRILEIGPGDGMLTQWLMRSRAGEITTVELDNRFSSLLINRFGLDKRFRLIENDFLKTSLSDLSSSDHQLRVVGNLPYAITSPILFRILENRSMVFDLTATVQKEVGERIISSPGKKTYGIPSVFFQLYSKVEILFNIPREAFFPIPKVDSAVLKIRFLSEPVFPVRDPKVFQTLVKTVFGQRRKMLRNTLKMFFREDTSLDGIPLDLSRRPETLTVEEFVLLSNSLHLADHG